MSHAGRLAAKASLAAMAIGEVLTPDSSYGQLPYYSGTVGKTYGLEGRYSASPEEGMSVVYITKFCPEICGVKMWSYAGLASGRKGVFWGVGPRLEYLDNGDLKISGIFSLDGSEGSLEGIASYNTLEYRNFFLDLSPGFHKDADGNLTPDFHANLGRTFRAGGLGSASIMLTGGMDNQKKPRDAYARAVFSKSAGNFVDLGAGYSFEGKAPVARISVQRSFGDGRSRKGGKG